MVKRLDVVEYIGKCYGRLSIIEGAPQIKGSKTRVIAVCICGRHPEGRLYGLSSLISGTTKSCGCLSSPIIGFTNKSRTGGLEYTLIRYEKDLHNKTVAIIRFAETKYEYGVEIKDVVIGNVKDPYNKVIAGVGFIGKGKYNSKNIGYQVWLSMLKRCYAPKSERDKDAYNDVVVEEYWHDFQKFMEWFSLNYREGWQLDKDFLVFRNRVYSRDTCTFLPRELNSFLVGGLKRGIHFNKGCGLWIVRCSDGEKNLDGLCIQSHIGSYSCENTALCAYKNFKLDKLRRLKEQYGDVVSCTVFDNIARIINELK